MSGTRGYLMIPIAVLVLLGGLLVPAWLRPGFIECRGYAEPVGWTAVYAPADGRIDQGTLEDGTNLVQGEEILRIDNTWPLYKKAQLEGQLKSVDTEYNQLELRLELFLDHRDIETAELSRLAEADRMLQASSSVSMNEMLHSEYLVEAFQAAALREEQEIRDSMADLDLRRSTLVMEMTHWEQRLEECVLRSPCDGVFFSFDTLFSGNSSVFTPPVGPGRSIESGRLLGYVVPDDVRRIRLYIDEQDIGKCRVGQRILVYPDSAGREPLPAAEGAITEVIPLASRGMVPAFATMDVSDGIPLCGALTVRIDTRGPTGHSPVSGLWERWVRIVNPVIPGDT